MFFCSCGDDSSLPPIDPPKNKTLSSETEKLEANDAVDEVIANELKLLPGESVKPVEELSDRGALKYLGADEDPFSGVAEDWHENGRRKSWARYADGQPDGKQFFWGSDGQKLQEAQFKVGILDGKQTFWWPNGTPKTELIWANGVRVEMRSWDNDGNLTHESKSSNSESDE
jgi:antitoxin component YwqK of YwqJK toxin-antitoxin module